MRDAIKNIFGKEITIEDKTVFLYTVEPYELKNALGAVVAILDAYSFTKKGSLETYQLYRTNEGNWYDAEKEQDEAKAFLLRQLKSAFAYAEK
jgi:hypothetical protein